jgi:hypothetical protein
MSYGYERKYKEPDDLSLTTMAQLSWDSVTYLLAHWDARPTRPTRLRLAKEAFSDFYNKTAPELWHRHCNLDELKLGRKDFNALWGLPPDAQRAVEFWDRYLRLLFDKGVISYQKVKDTDIGGH